VRTQTLAPPPAGQRAPVADWRDTVGQAERRGELLTAFDLAERGLAAHPDDVWLKHRAVLALARAGSTEEAARRFDSYGLGEVEDEDVVALRARIAKDVALAAHGEERRRRATRAASLYRTIFSRTRGFYPAINAATLSLIAGDVDQARTGAREVLELLRANVDQSYYVAATEAEAHLLLGDEAAARAALGRAATLHGDDYGAVSTTRRQLRTICDVEGIDPALLGALSGPPVVHYCGHLISAPAQDGPFPAQAEEHVAREIAAEIDRRPPRYAYGALASGADILWAEALLARGGELHVVLPFAQDEFIVSSVAPSGPRWVERFHRCIASAAAVSYATVDAFLDDDVLYRYGTELAMGLALLRAGYLDAEARQLAVWDGEPARGEAGTAIDVATWQRHGRPVTVISPREHPPGAALSPRSSGAARGSSRVVRAMLFADVKGFSKLTDEQLPRFTDRVLGAFAGVLKRYGEHVLHRNTWGDGLYVVLSDAGTAAACALDLQGAMQSIDLSAEHLPSHLALRLGGHLGPVFPMQDPILESPAFIGSHVSRTARIEPVTPPGSVYVTEPFAAALELALGDEFQCQYVGHMPAAKDFGRLRMYQLRRAK